MSDPEQIIVPGGASPATPQPLSVAVSVHNGQVIQHFSEPREYVALSGVEPVHIAAKLMASAVEADPSVGDSVIQFCMALIDGVYEVRGDLKPAGGAVKHELIERHRLKLTRRLEVVLGSRREKKKVNNAQLAREFVDICLSEVFS